MGMFDIFIWLNLFKYTTHQESLCQEKLGIQRKSSNFAAVLVRWGVAYEKGLPQEEKTLLPKHAQILTTK